jgi:hypothetical protein
MSDVAKKWKERLARKAAERAALVQIVPVSFAGFDGRAHRLDLFEFARAGRMPEYLAKAFFAAVNGQEAKAREGDLTPEELNAWLRFQRVAFCSMMDEPRFSIEDERKGRELYDDELDYSEFVVSFPEVVKEGVQWQLDGCPDIPVRTESGEVSIEDLRNFRDGGEWLTTPESYYRDEGVFWQPVASPRIM